MEAIINAILSVLDYLNPLSDKFILKSIIEFLGSILDYLNPFSENFILKLVLDFLGNILSYLNPFSENFLGYKLIDLLKEALIFVFVPKQSSFENLTSQVSSRFSFIDSIKIAISDIQDMLQNIDNGTAVFTVDINSPWYVGKATLFDLAWYKPFKPYGDLVFTGFAYVFFIWRLYMRLPSIISGGSGIVKIGRSGSDDY